VRGVNVGELFLRAETPPRAPRCWSAV